MKNVSIRWLLTLLVVGSILFSPIVQVNAQEQSESEPILVFLPVIFKPIIPVTHLGPAGGTFPAVAVDPSDPNVVFTGSYGAGAYRSDDSGLTWQAINTGLTNRFIQSMAVTPDGSTVYAGTYAGGIFRSNDRGASWTAINVNIIDKFIVYDIEIDIHNPRNVYISGRKQGTFEGSNPVLDGLAYRSTDGGDTWQNIWSGYSLSGSGDFAYDIDLSPDGTIIYLAAHQNGVIYKTGNDTWVEAQDKDYYDKSARNLAIDPLNPQYVYNSLYRSVGIMSSSNFGKTGEWSWLKNGLPGNSLYNFALETDPIVPSTLYLGTGSAGVYKSTDRGANWVSKGLISTFVWRFSLVPSESQRGFAGTGGNGVQYTSDGGDTWEWRAAGIYNTTVSALAVLPSQVDTIYAGTDGAGVYRSSDNGENWQQVNSGLADLNVMALRVIDGMLYAVTASNLYVSSNGVNWSVAASMAPAMQSTSNVESGAPFSHLIIQPEEVMLQKVQPLEVGSAAGIDAAQGVGTPVTAVAKALGGLWVGTSESGVISLDGSCQFQNGQAVYALREHQGVLWASFGRYDTDDKVMVYNVQRTGGSCDWTTTMDGLIYLDRVNDFASNGDRLFALSTRGVYIKIPGLFKWYAANGLTEPVYALTGDPVNPNRVYAAAESGAYFSDDNGTTWLPVPHAELRNIALVSVLVDPQDSGIVYFGSREGSTYRWNTALP